MHLAGLVPRYRNNRPPLSTPLKFTRFFPKICGTGQFFMNQQDRLLSMGGILHIFLQVPLNSGNR
jgi:hypothetical protein